MDEAIIMANLSKIIVFLLMFFAFFLMTVQSKKRLSNFLLSVFLVLTAFDLSSLFLQSWIAERPYLLAFKTSSVFLQMPLYLLYVQSICYAGFQVRYQHLLHTIPFFVFLIAALLPLELISQSYLVFSELQYLAYILSVIIILRRFKLLYLENYANLDDLDYKWLMQVTIVFLIAHIFVYIKLFMIYYGSSKYISVAQLIVTFSAFSVTCWLVLKALYKPEIFRGIDAGLNSVETLVDSGKESDVEEKKEEIAALKKYMEEKEPFLDAKLTIRDLAEQVGLPEKELSVLINHHMEKHFFDFVNEYRVEKAKSLLHDPAQSELTILEILYQVGFNSKSSFNTAFKKYTHKTPSQYRKTRTLEK
jgi:AraC-like DNA-binding protein